jgi:hypothetical protein
MITFSKREGKQLITLLGKLRGHSEGIVESSTTGDGRVGCPGGYGCTCCRRRCDCDCRDKCPRFKALAREVRICKRDMKLAEVFIERIERGDFRAGE